MLAHEKITSHSQLGFIGLGYLGSRIARRLVTAGFPMVVYDLDHTKSRPLAALGAEVARHPVELARKVDVVLSCLPGEESVMNVYEGANGVFANLHRDSLVIDMSTVYPETSQELLGLGSEREVDVLDVTVSGSTLAAEQGSLILFGGGDQRCFDAAEAILRVIGRKYFYVGPSGSGATMKLVVNTLLGIGMQAIAEAVALGEKAGLNRNRMLDVLAETTVIAPAHVGKLQRARIGDYSPQFPLRLMNKDFGLILNLAAAIGARMPATEAAFQVNDVESEQGNERDFSAVILRMEKQAHLDSADGAKTRIAAPREKSA
jgi:3-hydroxyisobutyrate dehydrogenase-like beta-hydroxyacid dehydrogenase